MLLLLLLLFFRRKLPNTRNGASCSWRRLRRWPGQDSLVVSVTLSSICLLSSRLEWRDSVQKEEIGRGIYVFYRSFEKRLVWAICRMIDSHWVLIEIRQKSWFIDAEPPRLNIRTKWNIIRVASRLRVVTWLCMYRIIENQWLIGHVHFPWLQIWSPRFLLLIIRGKRRCLH